MAQMPVNKAARAVKQNNAIPAAVTAAVTEFEVRRSDVLEFIKDNEDLMTAFMDLVLAYNTAHGAARMAVSSVKRDAGFTLGPFAVATPPKTVWWDPTALPHEVLLTPGVIGDLNNKVLDQMMHAGQLDPKVIAKGRKETTGTARVSGPKIIVIDP